MIVAAEPANETDDEYDGLIITICLLHQRSLDEIRKIVRAEIRDALQLDDSGVHLA